LFKGDSENKYGTTSEYAEGSREPSPQDLGFAALGCLPSGLRIIFRCLGTSLNQDPLFLSRVDTLIRRPLKNKRTPVGHSLPVKMGTSNAYDGTVYQIGLWKGTERSGVSMS